MEVYSRLTPDEAQDYDVIKLALLKRFDVTQDGFRKRFREVKPELCESFSHFNSRLANYYNRWIELSETEKTYAGLFDLMVREQLLLSCGRELAVFLKEREPQTADALAKIADQF